MAVARAACHSAISAVRGMAAVARRQARERIRVQAAVHALASWATEAEMELAGAATPADVTAIIDRLVGGIEERNEEIVRRLHDKG